MIQISIEWIKDQDDHNAFNGPSDGNNASADTIYSRASNMANSESQVLDHSGIQFLLAVSSQAEYCLPYQLASSSGLTQPQTPQRLLDNLTNGGVVSSPVLTIPQPHTTHKFNPWRIKLLFAPKLMKQM